MSPNMPVHKTSIVEARGAPFFVAVPCFTPTTTTDVQTQSSANLKTTNIVRDAKPQRHSGDPLR
jgi:hypothetical protein